jgi:hypothetical protein
MSSVVLNHRDKTWKIGFLVQIHSRFLEGAIRKDAQCLRCWKKNGGGAQTNLQRNLNGVLIKMLVDLKFPLVTEAETVVTTTYLTEGILDIRSYRNTRGSPVSTETLLGSSIITWHQLMEDTSI